MILRGVAITGLLAGVVGIAYLSHSAGSATGARRGSPTPDSSVPIAAHFPERPGTSSTRPRATTTAPATTAPATAAPTTAEPPSPTRPVDLIVTPPASTPPPTEAPTTSPPTSILLPAVTVTLPPPPPPFGADALTWTAPHVLVIASGGTATLSVRAHNPTDRIVSLSHPLACTPRLDHGELCAGLAQLIPAGGSASATYTIDATGVAAGKYTLTIEGVLTVPVTVS